MKDVKFCWIVTFSTHDTEQNIAAYNSYSRAQFVKEEIEKIDKKYELLKMQNPTTSRASLISSFSKDLENLGFLENWFIGYSSGHAFGIEELYLFTEE